MADADPEPASSGGDVDAPASQLVFCIDTRSEIIRRHIEDSGPYETHGYAGFFGIPIRHEEYGEHVSTDSCPVMVDPKHRVAERPTEDAPAERHDRWSSLSHAGHKLMKSLKNDVAGAFGFVEGAGGFFGAALTARTLLPSRMYDLRENAGAPRDEAFCEPGVDHPDEAGEDDSEPGTASPPADELSSETAVEETLALEPEHDLPAGISTEQRTYYAEAAFDLMGWDEFAPVVVFAGHASQTVNNPYESSIDCGACAGSSGVPNARALAEICNDPEVRANLRERGHEIPEETVFVAAEHNTTTDEVTLFADADARERHPDVFERLEADLETAREGATAERVETIDGEAPAESARET
ncbi:putative inorganic carbon transporter subunit DabA, partial [Natronoarchaeum mannanilyticum]|uniref:putative inorganic carbon transporter subunit DabA n=1 Tax=Natronoarchaeum mannanilyticum TaxID=926360 RepID=UPI00360F450B